MLGLFTFFIGGGYLFGLVGLVLGFVGLAKARKSGSGKGLAVAGLITSALALIGSIVATIFFVSVFGGSGFGTLIECTNAADDQAEIDECNREFEDRLDENFGQ